jgi:hypothetical protein
MVIREVVPAPVSVDIRVELQLFHAYAAKHSRNRDAKHNLPDDFQRNTKGVPHFVLERLVQRRNSRDSLECYLNALREPRKERGR